MVLMVGLGLGAALKAVPQAELAMKIAALAYMLWLAWKIAHAAAPGDGLSAGKPFTFLQAAAFQWVNPKAWAMAIGVMAAYGADGDTARIALIAGLFAVINFPSILVWAWAGQALRAYLQEPSKLRAFNWTMAVLLIASLWPVLQM
jgi:threonine/homoserine/homoserine lactone efflux protein